MSRYDPTAEQVRALNNRCGGGIFHIQKVLLGRNLRNALSGPLTETRARIILSKIVEELFPDDPRIGDAPDV